MPQFVEATEEFTIRTSEQRCIEFFSSLASIGSCIPGCESVREIDPESAFFKVKFKAGYISRTFELKARLAKGEQNRHFEFRGEGADAEVHGFLDLKQNDGVKVRYRLTITGTSITGKTALSMMGKDIVTKQASEFAKCVKQKLEESA